MKLGENVERFMKLPADLTQVTIFSKLIALILFIALPFAGFLAGVSYQKSVDQTYDFVLITPSPTLELVPSETVFCTQDALECPDGSWVGRTGPKCEFAPCPGSK